MAQWVSANMAGFLPEGTETILEQVEALVGVVKPPLDVVSAALEISKTFLTSQPAFDFLGALRELVQEFKETVLFGGLYSCQMWDYPVRQVQNKVGPLSVKNYGPDATYDKLEFKGHTFEESFLSDLLKSFDDPYDTNRPQFTGDVSMLLLVTSAASINQMGLNGGEDHLGDSIYGMKRTIAASAKTLRRLRLAAMLGKLKFTAQNQPADKVAIRVSRIEQAIHRLNQMTDTELDAIELPESETDSFFEERNFNDLGWLDEVLPVLQSMERQVVPPQYPDWTKVSLADANPGVVSYVNTVLDPILDLLKQGPTITSGIVQLINAIDTKIKFLEDVIDQISTVKEEFDRMLESSGFHAIYVSTSNGIADLRIQLKNATDLPFTGKGFYAGYALLAGPGSKTAFDFMFAPIAG